MPRNDPTVQVTIDAADPVGKEASQLLQDMRVEALSRYGDVIDTATPAPTNDPLVPHSAFLIARYGGQPVGCAALRPMDEQCAEVRRMYVAPSVRRKGIGRQLLATLEQIALQFGYSMLRLETGLRQPEAIALYKAHGFHRIPGYGVHVDEPLSICFEKKIGPVALRPET